MRSIGSLTLVVSIALIAGCSTGIRSQGPVPPKAVQPAGLKYHIGKDVVVITGEVTYALVKSIDDNTIEVRSEVKYVSTTIDPSLQTVADPGHAYVLNLEPRGLKDQQLALVISDSGLLTSVNLTTTDKTGEFITNIGKSIASVAGAFFGFRAAAQPAVDAVFTKSVEPDIDAAVDPKINEKLRKRFLQLPPELVFLIREYPDVRREWIRLALDEVELETLGKKARELVAQITTETDEAKVKHLERAISFTERAAKTVEQQLTERRSQFEATLEKRRSELKLGKKEYTRSISRTLEIYELPPSSMILSSKSRDEPSIKIALASFPAALALFEEAKVIVTADGLDDLRSVTLPAQDTATSTPAQDKKARFYYRPTRPVVVQTFGLRVTPDQEKLDAIPIVVRLSQKIAMVADPRTTPSFVEFDSRAFSNQAISLGFNGRGQLISAGQGASSPLAGAAASVSGAISGARDEFAASLVKAKEIITTRQQIELGELDFRISELTKRKAIVDQRLALAGATSNYDVMLEKLEVEQQLALLNQQQALAKQQLLDKPSLEQEVLKAEVALLTQQVQLLQQQIEQIKKQRELDQLRNP